MYDLMIACEPILSVSALPNLMKATQCHFKTQTKKKYIQANPNLDGIVGTLWSVDTLCLAHLAVCPGPHNTVV